MRPWGQSSRWQPTGLLILPFVSFSQKPIDVFLAFWEEMDENYAFFNLRGVDWDQVYTDYRPQITENMSDTALFEVLTDILAPFEDGHINLRSKEPKLKFTGGRPVPFEEAFSTDSLLRNYFGVVDATLNANGFTPLERAGPILSEKTALYDHSVYEYSQSSSYGYIKISWFFHDYENVQKIAGVGKDKKAFVEDFEEIFNQLKNKEGLILDLRNNIGGVDGYPEELVAYFSDEKFAGEFTAIRKKDHREAFTEPKPTWVKPAKGYVFKKPVIVLVNGMTVSAAEEFVQMMAGLKQVTIVGTPTQGALSDIYETKLPNGWTFTFSNMRFYDAEMKCWEGTGIPVDVEAQNTLENLKTRKDPVLQTGIDLLKAGW
ncbi:MAG: S41 family peptidase [Bacteroidota bacterium]